MTHGVCFRRNRWAQTPLERGRGLQAQLGGQWRCDTDLSQPLLPQFSVGSGHRAPGSASGAAHSIPPALRELARVGLAVPRAVLRVPRELPTTPEPVPVTPAVLSYPLTAYTAATAPPAPSSQPTSGNYQQNGVFPIFGRNSLTDCPPGDTVPRPLPAPTAAGCRQALTFFRGTLKAMKRVPGSLRPSGT